MSKSLGNVVSPDEMIARYGADSARMYTLFATSPDRELDWQDEGVEGIQRFLGRVYRLVARNAPVETQLAASPRAERATLQPTLQATSVQPEARKMQRKLHQTIKRVSDDFQGRWHFNTSIAAIMELVNELYVVEERVARAPSPAEIVPAALWSDVQRNLVLLLAPFAPHLASELWEMLGEKASLLRVPWPKYDPALAKEDEIEIPVQVNGKLRGLIVVPADSPKDAIQEHALSNERVKAAIAGKQVVKVIFVPGKLINVVVR